MFEDIAGKRILVVGATGGIGHQLAEGLSLLSANIILSGRNDAVLSEFQKRFDCKVIRADIDIANEVDELCNQLEPLDGVCILSGVVKLVPPKLLTKKMVDSQIITNLASPLNLIGALLRKGKIKDGGSVILTSAAGRICQPPCTAPYAGAKLGLIGAAKSLSADLSSKKIRVNTVSFDYVDTEMIARVITDTRETIGISPVQYTTIPYLFLLSSASRWMTGQLVAADAGRMLSKVRYA